VLWTVLTTREYSPDEMASFRVTQDAETGVTIDALANRSYGPSVLWIAFGISVLFAVAGWGLQKEVYLLGVLLVAYGIANAAGIFLARTGRTSNILANIVGDFSGMPTIMKRLAVVQFFSWSALYTMWVFTTPVVAQYFYGSADAASPAYQRGANRVDELFAVYNGVAALAALTLLPLLARTLGKARTHAICLMAGAAGYASFFLIKDPKMLVFSELGIGVAWASILAMPYAILASSLPQRKLGIYMGLFNIFIVVPQLLVATIMGSIMKAFFPGEPIWTMLGAALVMAIAALAMLRVTALEQQ
jgi:maltose/moltooligosaccharide transporter